MQTHLSLDNCELDRWRFTDINGFVVKDWTGIEKGGEPAIMVLKPSDIFEFIASAAINKQKIAVYAIGPRLLDWS